MSTVSAPQEQSSLARETAPVATRFGSDANFLQSVQNALVITRREVRDSFRDWRIMAPIVLLTLIFPVMANGASLTFINFFDSYGADGDEFVEAFLPLMPMIVGFFPVSISLVIALETFVGEKERRSLEPLLSTPLTNTELYMGKVLAATIPPLMAAYLGITIYLGGLILGSQQWRPDFILVVQILSLTTVQAIVMVTGAVVISSQTTSTRAANLLASIIIIPMSLLVMFESVIMVQPKQRYILWWIIAGLIIVVVLLVRTGARIFNREELLGRAVDQLNFKWAWQVFSDQLRGISHAERDAFQNRGEPLPTRKGIVAWYRTAVFPVFPTLGKPTIILALAIGVFFVGGWSISSSYRLPLDGEPPVYEVHVTEAFQAAIAHPFLISSETPYTVASIPDEDAPVITVTQQFEKSVNALQPVEMSVETPPWLYSDEALLNRLRDLYDIGFRDPSWFGLALGQNVRFLTLALILGILSFGVLSTVMVAMPFGILGYALGNFAATGTNPMPFILSLLPHSIFELPAFLIAAVVILRAASSVTGEMKGLSVGEVWLRALADGTKVFWGIVFPMLVVAATLEVTISPQFVEWALEIGFNR